MTAHVILLLLSFLNGGYMLADGLHVMFNGKYMGPSKPGPWAVILYKLEINVFKLGPLFVSFGVLWLVFMVGLWLGFAWAYPLGLFMALMTLWYLPIGTVFSIVVFVLLYMTKSQVGF